MFIEGQGCPKDSLSTYSRLPGKAKGIVRKTLWDLSKHSAGLSIRFRSNANNIVVRYGLINKEVAMPHMPATGVSRVDLYEKNIDSNWVWFKGNYSFGDTIKYHFKNIDKKIRNNSEKYIYQLFLPLYNGIQWLEIGVPVHDEFEPLPLRNDKPIVVYGTSIAQGACASRPGMARTLILERKLNRPIVNLSMSGNGLLEKEMIDLISGINAEIYVLDCLPNLVMNKNRTSEKVYKKIIFSVKKIREKHQETPVILVDHAGYAEGSTNRNRFSAYADLNQINHRAYGRLREEGIRNVYILRKIEIDLQPDSYVDGTHPSDLGMMEYAGAFEKVIYKVIDEKQL